MEQRTNRPAVLGSQGLGDLHDDPQRYRPLPSSPPPVLPAIPTATATATTAHQDNTAARATRSPRTVAVVGHLVGGSSPPQRMPPDAATQPRAKLDAPRLRVAQLSVQATQALGNHHIPAEDPEQPPAIAARPRCSPALARALCAAAAAFFVAFAREEEAAAGSGHSAGEQS